MKSLRALLVSYAFPPIGGAGIQRSVKLAKYLPDWDVHPSILTVDNASAPLRDETFDKDFPPGMEIVRARTLEPGYGVKQATWTHAQKEVPLKKRVMGKAVAVAKQMLVPDPQVLWLPWANLALGIRLARKQDDVVFITAPPFSEFWLAPLVRMRPGTAVVLDYRDEWSTLRTTYEMLQARVTATVGAAMENGLLRCAHAITTATEGFRENLLRQYPFLDPKRVIAIPNGYDPDDFPADLPTPPTDKLVVTYAGTIFKLTSARGLLGAIRKLHERSPELAKLLQVRFIGRIVETELPLFDGTESLGVERLGYLGHETMMGELAKSHLVTCLLDDVPGVERIYPAKIFELMHLGRPVLTLAPEGELTRLVERHRLGPVLAPRNEDAIASYLEEQLRAFRAGGSVPSAEVDRAGIAQYHRRELAGRFAEVMRDAVALARR